MSKATENRAGKYDALEAEFIAGAMTVRELATAHGVSYDALRSAANRRSWRRRRHERALRIAEQAEAEALAKCREWNSADAEAAGKLRETVLKLLERADVMTFQDARQAAAARPNAHAVGRMALGIEGRKLERAPIWASASGRELDSLCTIRDYAADAEIKAELRARDMPESMCDYVRLFMAEEELDALPKGGAAEAVTRAIEQAAEEMEALRREEMQQGAAE